MLSMPTNYAFGGSQSTFLAKNFEKINSTRV